MGPYVSFSNKLTASLTLALIYLQGQVQYKDQPNWKLQRTATSQSMMPLPSVQCSMYRSTDLVHVVPQYQQLPQLLRSEYWVNNCTRCRIKPDVPRAMVLADPAACKHRRSMRSQYALVGVRASPTHASAKTSMQARNMGLLPHRSASVPQNIGAITKSGGHEKNQYSLQIQILTNSLDNHVDRDGQVNVFN